MGTVHDHDHGELKMDEHYRAIFRIFLFQTLGQFIISLPLTLHCPGPELRLIKAAECSLFLGKQNVKLVLSRDHLCGR